MADAFTIKLHAFRYLEITTSTNLQFSLTWSFTQEASGLVFSDTMSGCLAWVNRYSGALEWTPHLSKMGRRSITFHTPSTDLNALVIRTLKDSGHMQPLITEYEDARTHRNTFLPDDPTTDLEVTL